MNKLIFNQILDKARGVTLLLPLFLLTACQKDDGPGRPLTELESRGKAIYFTNCIVCHNPDPRLDGSMGPAITGSSFELLNARVLTRGYPEGYKPKRTSEIMPDFPGLKDDIPAIHAFLQSYFPQEQAE